MLRLRASSLYNVRSLILRLQASLLGYVRSLMLRLRASQLCYVRSLMLRLRALLLCDVRSLMLRLRASLSCYVGSLMWRLQASLLCDVRSLMLRLQALHCVMFEASCWGFELHYCDEFSNIAQKSCLKPHRVQATKAHRIWFIWRNIFLKFLARNCFFQKLGNILIISKRKALWKYS